MSTMSWSDRKSIPSIKSKHVVFQNVDNSSITLCLSDIMFVILLKRKQHITPAGNIRNGIDAPRKCCDLDSNV